MPKYSTLIEEVERINSLIVGHLNSRLNGFDRKFPLDEITPMLKNAYNIADALKKEEREDG